MATKIKNTIENIKPVNSLPIIFKNHFLTNNVAVSGSQGLY